MEEKKTEEFECTHCSSKIKRDDDFCPDCGTLFGDEVKCSEHKNWSRK